MLNRGEIEGRLEPKSFLLKYRVNDENINNSRFPKYQLRKISKLISDGTHFTPKYTEKGVKFLSVKDVRPFEINYDNSKFISIDEAEILDKRCKPQKGDILLTKIGTIGLASVINSVERFQIFVSLALLRTDNELILPEYLTLTINSNFTFLQFDRIIKGAGVPDLHLEDIRKVKIPVPPIEIQKQIVENFEKAYAEKKAKEAEAREKLASVDNLVLDALGITLPAKEENTLEKRIFFTKSSDIASGRFDAAIHQRKFSLQSNLFPMAKLKDVYAINPRTSFDRFKPETLLSFVPMESISDGLGKIIRKYECEVKESKGYTSFQENDVLWAKITPCMQNGKSAVATNLLNGYGFGSTEYHVFRSLSLEANPFYLHSILRLKSLRKAAMNYFGGSAGHQRVDVNFFKTLKIPIPPPEVQAEIAERVEAIYAEAKQLREEGAEILKNAKAEVERMILGEK